MWAAWPCRLGQAIDFLLTIARTRGIGADLRAWHTAALLAMEMVGAQQVMPVLLRDGFRLKRHGELVLIREWQKLTALAPASRRSVAPRSPILPPRRTHAHLSTISSQRLSTLPCARLPFKPLLPPTTPGGKWLAALLGRRPIVDLKGPEADALYKSWQAWAGQAQVAGDDVFRITFRLEPPERAERPLALAFLLRATDDPSLIVPASQIWRERGATFNYLDRRFEHPQERLLAGLGYAARLFPPLEASLSRPRPTAPSFRRRRPSPFSRRPRRCWREAASACMVPAWWQGRGARLQARARAKGKGQGPNAKSLLNFDALVSFNWELTLGGAADRPGRVRAAGGAQAAAGAAARPVGGARPRADRAGAEVFRAPRWRAVAGRGPAARPGRGWPGAARRRRVRRPGGRRLAQGSAGAAERRPND